MEITSFCLCRSGYVFAKAHILWLKFTDIRIEIACMTYRHGKKLKFLILGGNGFLGSALSSYLERDYNVITGVRSGYQGNRKLNFVDLKYHDSKFLGEQISQLNPDVVINCIAVADVDECERNLGGARNVMVHQFKDILGIICEMDVPFIHISTDQLYTDNSQTKFSEADCTSPCNNYGRLKLMSEQICLENCEKSIILRTNFFGRNPSGHISSTESIVKRLINGGIYHGFQDVRYTPVHTQVIGKVVSEFESIPMSQVYNISSDEVISKYDFVLKICEKLDLDRNLVKEGKVEQFGLLAKRSNNMALCNKKIKSIFPNLDLSFEKSLDYFVNELVVSN